MSSGPTDEQKERTALRTKLYSGCTLVFAGRGGVPIPESCADKRKPGLVEMWPKYLTVELAASKPTLSLPDVACIPARLKVPWSPLDRRERRCCVTNMQANLKTSTPNLTSENLWTRLRRPRHNQERWRKETRSIAKPARCG